MWLLNQYRVAEIHGAGAVMRMARLADSTSLSVSLSRHLRDEAAHAWMWTKVIEKLGGEVDEVDLPYQARTSLHFGIPRTLTELLALTFVSERRGVLQYTEHLESADTTPLIHRTLRGILKDEHWHVRYIDEELGQRVRADRRVQDIVDRALAAEERAVAELTVGDAAAAMPGQGGE